MQRDMVVRVLRSVRDRQVIGRALIAGMMALAIQTAPPIAAQLEALIVETQTMVESNFEEVSQLLASVVTDAAA